MHFYRTRAAEDEEGQPRQTIDLSQLQGLPVPSGSGAFSETGSVSSFSLPPTPRMSRSGSNGISRQPSRSSSGGDIGLRMVFVVRRDLAWSKQKLSVMTAHAALALFKKLYKGRNPVLMQWELAKGPKLVLRADNEQQLLAALEAARAAGIPYHSIAEASTSSSDGGAAAAGRSSGGGGDVAVPRKSRTILALGPLPAEDLPKVAAGLVLL